MKPAPFEYLRPDTVEEVLHLLAEYGDEAKLLAGGQSLIPTMNFRLAQPSVLIDLNRVEGLDGLDEADGGGLRLGAMVSCGGEERAGGREGAAPGRDPPLCRPCANPQPRHHRR